MVHMYRCSWTTSRLCGGIWNNMHVLRRLKKNLFRVIAHFKWFLQLTPPSLFTHWYSWICEFQSQNDSGFIPRGKWPRNVMIYGDRDEMMLDIWELVNPHTWEARDLNTNHSLDFSWHRLCTINTHLLSPWHICFQAVVCLHVFTVELNKYKTSVRLGCIYQAAGLGKSSTDTGCLGPMWILGLLSKHILPFPFKTKCNFTSF